MAIAIFKDFEILRIEDHFYEAGSFEGTFADNVTMVADITVDMLYKNEWFTLLIQPPILGDYESFSSDETGKGLSLEIQQDIFNHIIDKTDLSFDEFVHHYINRYGLNHRVSLKHNDKMYIGKVIELETREDEIAKIKESQHDNILVIEVDKITPAYVYDLLKNEDFNEIEQFRQYNYFKNKLDEWMDYIDRDDDSANYYISELKGILMTTIIHYLRNQIYNGKLQADKVVILDGERDIEYEMCYLVKYLVVNAKSERKIVLSIDELL